MKGRAVSRSWRPVFWAIAHKRKSNWARPLWAPLSISASTSSPIKQCVVDNGRSVVLATLVRLSACPVISNAESIARTLDVALRPGYELPPAMDGFLQELSMSLLSSR